MNAVWVEKPLEDCIENVTYPRKVQRKDFLQEGVFPVISQESEFINGYWDDPTILFRVRRPVVIFGDHTQVLKYVDFDFVLGADGVKVLVPRDFLIPKYFYYCLMAHPLPTLGYARHYRLLKDIRVAFPPLSEQQRIVAILDEAFEGLAVAVANAEKNLKNARELFDSYLNSVFTHKGERWVDKPIGDISQVFDGPHATPKTVEAGPIFLGISALQDGVVNLNETRHVTAEDFKKWTRRVIPQEGDVVFSYETRLGQAAIIPNGLECCLGRRMGLIRVDRSEIDPRFFVYQYISPPFRAFLEMKAIRGATVDRISLKEFPFYSLKVPPLNEQIHLVSKIELIARTSKDLADRQTHKLAAVADLKQSILQKTFDGELTNQPSATAMEAVA